MTKQRMIELLEIEHECIRRNAHTECDRDCEKCDLVQDDHDLDEMYTGVIALLKEQEDALEQMRLDNTDLRNCNAELMKAQEAKQVIKQTYHVMTNWDYENPVEVTRYDWLCPTCKSLLCRDIDVIDDNYHFCKVCGQAVKWNV